MNLTPREKDKLLISMAALVGSPTAGARRELIIEPCTDHRFRGCQGARDGRSVADLMEAGAGVLTSRFRSWTNSGMITTCRSRRRSRRHQTGDGA